MNKWDARFLAEARQVATWSKDPRRQVGAVVVSPDRRHVSWGYNGFPRGIADTYDRLHNREEKNRLIIHAEANALLNSATDVTGWTLYCTYSPCVRCALMIIQTGIARVVTCGMTSRTSDWYDESVEAESLLNEANVEIEHEVTAEQIYGYQQDKRMRD